VISTQRLYDLLSASGRPDLTTLDRRTATRLARWAGAGVVISGSIFRSGSTYRIDVQAHDTGGGQVIAAARVEGSDIFKMADQLASKLRQGLQIATTDDREIEAMTTSYREAYRSFTAGMKAYDELEFAGASEHFRGALAVDTAYATAQLRLGMSLLLDGEGDDATLWLRRAARDTARMSSRDRLLTQALKARFVDGDMETAAKRLEDMVQLHPADVEAHVWRALGASSGPMGAVKALRQALDLDPNHPLAVAALVSQMEELGLSDDAEEILGNFLERNPAVAEGPIRDLRIAGIGAL
jgi:tetratricopeptide (TPR) repeat protein